MTTARQLIGVEGFALALTLVAVTHVENVVAAPPSSITLVNETGVTLTFYAVNESPPPSRLPSGTTATGSTFDIDPEGYNPVLAYPDGINLGGTDPNGFLIGLALADDPPLLQYKLFHYKVVPGEADKDPDLQPILINQEIFELTEDAVVIVVDSDWVATLGAPTGACCNWAAYACTDGTYGFDCQGADKEWSQDVLCANLDPPCVPTGACCNRATYSCNDGVPESSCLGADEEWSQDVLCTNLDPPCAATSACCEYYGACSESPSAVACGDGISATFISGVSCSPDPCGSVDEPIDSETGGTVETPDGAVSIEIDPGDLCDDETISIAQRESDEQHYIYLTGSSEVEMQYHFEPDNLEFCGDVMLCMTLDVTDLSMEDRAALRLSRRGLACGAPNTCDYCNVDGDCGGATCDVRFCGLQALPCNFNEVDGRTIAECCVDIPHFSDYALITPADADGDGVPDDFEGVSDNCLRVWNPLQRDQDHDGIGDACECWYPIVCGHAGITWVALLLICGVVQITRRRHTA